MGTPFWDNSTGVDGEIVAPGADGPLYVDNPWDTCKLQGIHLPGIVSVYVPSKSRRVQRKKKNGADGETPTFRGLNGAKVTITVEIWTADQFDLWESMLPIIFPNPNKDVNKLSALDISSTSTHHRGVASIIVEDIDGPTPGQQHGAKRWVLKCFEYTPEGKKSATRTVVGAVATTDAFKAVEKAKNNPPPPSQTDFGPTPAPTPQQGNS